MATATKTKIYRWVKKYLDKEKAYYKKDDVKKELQTVAFLDDNENSIIMIISCHEMLVEIDACFEHFADEKSRINVLEYLMRINSNLKNGCFIINLENGEICLRSNLNTFDRETLSDDLIGLTLAGPRFIFNYYYKGLLDVMSGKKSPEQAANEILRRNHESCSCGCEH